MTVTASGHSQSTWGRRIADRMIRRLPLRRQALYLGAALSPALKGGNRLKCLAALHARTVLSPDADIRTNLGISGRYRLHLPAAASAAYLYGSLNDHRGERGALRLARVLAKRSAAFVDVGAHLGLFLFHVAEAAPETPIYYFEPSPSLFRRLEANVGRNHLPRVVGFQRAVGRSTGRAPWFENISDSLSSSLTEMFRATHETFETDVDVISFGEFCRRRNLERLCVKVDIEGAEFEFLEGAGDELWRINFLIMEVLGPAIAKGFVRACQEASGMEAYYINDFRLEHTRSGAFRYVESQYNWLFCRLPPPALKATLSDARLQVVSD